MFLRFGGAPRSAGAGVTNGGYGYTGERSSECGAVIAVVAVEEILTESVVTAVDTRIRAMYRLSGCMGTGGVAVLF